MNKIIDNTNLNINSLLINWSLLSGQLDDGIIEQTIIGSFYQWLTFCLCIFHVIKWLILIFTPHESETSHLLGEWAYFYGPKIIIDYNIIFVALQIITVKLLFLYASKHPKKMFYWLEALAYNDDNDSFDKLNLNKTESKMFIKRLSISIFVLKIFTFTFVPFFAIVNFVLVFKWQSNHVLNYLISLLLYLPQLYLNMQFIFGFLVLLYPVR